MQKRNESSRVETATAATENVPKPIGKFGLRRNFRSRRPALFHKHGGQHETSIGGRFTFIASRTAQKSEKE